MNRQEARERNREIRSNSQWEHYDTTTSPNRGGDGWWLLLFLAACVAGGLAYLVSLSGGK